MSEARKMTVRIAVGIDHCERVTAVACHTLNREDRFGAALSAAASGLEGQANLYYVEVELDVPSPPVHAKVLEGNAIPAEKPTPAIPSSERGRINPVTEEKAR